MSKIHISDFKDKKINMHTHTARCQHAKGEDREYVECAIEAGYEVLGFSDHAPYLFEKDYISPIRMPMQELEGYVDSIYALKKEYECDIKIYCGLEMEYFPQYFDRTIEELDKYPIEYFILGQHFYTQEDGWNSLKKAQADEAHLQLYVDRVMTGLKMDKFFYVAHPDIMCFVGENETYRKHMMPLIRELKDRGMPIEINMNGFRAGLHYPTPAFIELGVENGNDFIIGVDAHSPEKLLELEMYQQCKQLVLKYGGNIINCLNAKEER